MKVIITGGPMYLERHPGSLVLSTGTQTVKKTGVGDTSGSGGHLHRSPLEEEPN